MNIFKRNDALRLNGNTVNGSTAQIAITTRGSDWYFTVSAIMALSTIIFSLLALRRPRNERMFHYITAAITAVAAIAYFTMGANLGFTPIAVQFLRSDRRVAGLNREIFYVRYIDWFITTPLLLLDLMLTAGLSWPTIFAVILADWVMIVSGLIGALVRSRYKWAYFVIGNVAFFYVLWKLIWAGRRSAHALGPHIHKTYLRCGLLTLFVWMLYPVAWGVSEGGNVIAPDSEAVFYGILDIIAKPIFGALLLLGHRNIKAAELGLRFRGSNARNADGTYGDKHTTQPGDNHVTHPATDTTTGVTALAAGHNGAQHGTRNGIHNGAQHTPTTINTAPEVTGEKYSV